MLDQTRLAAIRDTIRDLVEDLDEYEDLPPEEPPTSPLEEEDEAAPTTLPVLAPEALKPAWRGETPVICTAGRNPLDEAAALMLAQLLRKHGIAASVQGPQGLSETAADRSIYAGAAMLCLSYVDLSTPAHMRYAIRRLRRMAPGAKVLIGCWSADLDPQALETLRESVKADLAATSLRQALALCIDQAADPDAVVPATREDAVTAA